MFTGLVGLALAAAGVWDVFRRRDRSARILVVTWLGIALVAWVLSWGPYAAIGPWRVPLPYQWLSKLSGVFGLIRVPPRWMIAAGLPIAALAGYGARFVLCTCCRRAGATVREPRRPQRAVLFVVIGAMLVLESWCVPLPLAAVGRTADLAPVYRWLAASRAILPCSNGRCTSRRDLNIRRRRGSMPPRCTGSHWSTATADSRRSGRPRSTRS